MRQGVDDFAVMREDLDYCLENSVAAFTNDLKVFQFALNTEKARRHEAEPGQTPLVRKQSDSQVAERARVQGMNRDELQALLASKFSGKRFFS